MSDDKSRGPRDEEPKPGPDKPRNYQSGSFLVRFWVEPSESGDQVLRGCIKNLQTGKEQYVNDPGKIGDLVRGHLKEKEKKGGKAEEAGRGSEREDGQPWKGQH